MPTSRNMAIFMLMTTTTTRSITLPLAHVRGMTTCMYMYLAGSSKQSGGIQEDLDFVVR